MASRQKTVLLLGNFRPALATARALREADYRTILGQEGEYLGVESSRYIDEIWNHPDTAEGTGNFLGALKSLLLTRQDILAVLPVSEEFMAILAGADDELRRLTVLASPVAKTVNQFTRKLAALDFAESVGVPTLPYAHVTNHADLALSAEKIGFPLTIRAFGTTARIGEKKALILQSQRELYRQLPYWPSGHEALLLQKFAVGNRHNVWFAAWQGELLGVVQSRIFRTDMPDGTGLAVDGVTEAPSKALLEQTQKLVSKSSYSGIGLAQFIVNPQSGQSCFLELNPRISGSHAVPEQAGLPLSRLAIEIALDERGRAEAPKSISQSSIRTGVRYAWTSGELLAAKHALMRGEIGVVRCITTFGRAILTSAMAKIHMIGSWKDPMPAIYAALTLMPGLGFVRRAFKQMFISIGQKSFNKATEHLRDGSVESGSRGVTRLKGLHS